MAETSSLLSEWLTKQLLADPWIDRYLVRAEVYRFGKASGGAAQTEIDFRTCFVNYLYEIVQNLWATESNRRESLRDAPAEYAKVADRINDLRAAQINRPTR